MTTLQSVTVENVSPAKALPRLQVSDFVCASSNERCNFSGAFLGWVRFKINQLITNANLSTTSTAESGSADWTTAFYLTRVDKIRAILDHGQPLPIGTCFIEFCFVLFFSHFEVNKKIF